MDMDLMEQSVAISTLIEPIQFSQEPVVILIDGENHSPVLAEWIMFVGSRYGCSTIRNIYGSEQTFRAWRDAITTYHFEPRLHNGGKNAADHMMIMDAHALALAGQKRFLFATKDGDMAGIALALRLWGCKVYGLGSSTPSTKLLGYCQEYATVKVGKATVDISIQINPPLDTLETLCCLNC
jgi:hypothetical protein